MLLSVAHQLQASLLSKGQKPSFKCNFMYFYGYESLVAKCADNNSCFCS